MSRDADKIREAEIGEALNQVDQEAWELANAQAQYDGGEGEWSRDGIKRAAERYRRACDGLVALYARHQFEAYDEAHPEVAS